MKIIMCVLILFFLVSGCSTNISSPESLTQASISKVKEQILQKGLFLSLDCKEKITPDCLCEADISYPIISGLGNETTQAVLNQNFKKVAEAEYKCEGKPTKITEDIGKNEVFLRYKVTFESPEILSILNYGYEFGAGAAHGNESAEGFIIDVETGKKLSAKDIFGENIDQVNQVIYEKLIPIGFPDKIKERKGKFIEGDICNDCSLFLSKEGVKIVFTKYAVTPGVEGNPEVLIPKKYITYPAIAHYFK